MSRRTGHLLLGRGNEALSIRSSVHLAVDRVPTGPGLARLTKASIASNIVLRDDTTSSPRLVEAVGSLGVVVIFQPSRSCATATSLRGNGKFAGDATSGQGEGVDLSAEMGNQQVGAQDGRGQGEADQQVG